MMRLKLSLRNSARPALLFSLSIFIIILFFGCEAQIGSTYKERDIPYLVKKICKEEYRLDVTTIRTFNTLWIYAPVDKILHKDYGVKEDKFFDEELSEKLRNILITTGRVLLSSDNAPEFFGLLASDVKLGLDYTIIGNVLDIKKSYSGSIPWPEANRRYVMRFKLSPEAVDDLTGGHLRDFDVKFPDFLAEQIAQRISGQFHDESLKKYFKVEKSTGSFINNAFVFEYLIEQVAKTDKKIDIKEKALDIIAYCIRTYEFKDFSTVEINDALTQEKIILSRAAIEARPIN